MSREKQRERSGVRNEERSEHEEVPTGDRAENTASETGWGN